MSLINTNLQLIISICPSANGKTLTLSEATGVYNALSNPGGWANPEILNSNPSANNPAGTYNRELTITSPTGAVKTYTNAQLIGIFPDPTGANTIVLDNSAFNGSASDTLPDGTYEVTYKIDGQINAGADTYSEQASAKYFAVSELDCCLDLLFHAVGTDCDNCKSEKLAAALEVDAYIKAAQSALDCDDSAKATKLTLKAQWICNTFNCLNCL